MAPQPVGLIPEPLENLWASVQDKLHALGDHIGEGMHSLQVCTCTLANVSVQRLQCKNGIMCNILLWAIIILEPVEEILPVPNYAASLIHSHTVHAFL